MNILNVYNCTPIQSEQLAIVCLAGIIEVMQISPETNNELRVQFADQQETNKSSEVRTICSHLLQLIDIVENEAKAQREHLEEQAFAYGSPD